MVKKWNGGWFNCPRDEEKAKRWLAQAIKHEKHPVGMYSYDNAMCGVVIQNPQKAKELYTEASNFGCIPAMHELAACLYEGLERVTGQAGGLSTTSTRANAQIFSVVIKTLVFVRSNNILSPYYC